MCPCNRAAIASCAPCIARRRIIGADAAIGVVTTASFAVGLARLNRYGQAQKSIEAVLFGSVLGVRPGDVLVLGSARGSLPEGAAVRLSNPPAPERKAD